MPVHDWTRVFAGLFHDFHHEWLSTIKHALNREFQGTEYYALAEQFTGDFGPDVLTLQRPARGEKPATQPADSRSTPARSASRSERGGVAVAERPRRTRTRSLTSSPPKLRYFIEDEKRWYARKKKAVTIRHVSEHNLVAVLEIMSAGNKASQGDLNDFVHKAHELLKAGVHFALVDLFPPTRRDPEGIHPILWGDDDQAIFQFDPAKPLTCASYRASRGGPTQAFVELTGIGDTLPGLPVFLAGDEYVSVPLEDTYQAAFSEVPEVWREVLAAR